MNVNTDLKVIPKIEQVDMIPAEHLSIEEAIEKLKELGHDIIKVDKTTRKITVLKNGK